MKRARDGPIEEGGGGGESNAPDPTSKPKRRQLHIIHHRGVRIRDALRSSRLDVDSSGFWGRRQYTVDGWSVCSIGEHIREKVIPDISNPHYSCGECLVDDLPSDVEIALNLLAPACVGNPYVTGPGPTNPTELLNRLIDYFQRLMPPGSRYAFFYVRQQPQYYIDGKFPLFWCYGAWLDTQAAFRACTRRRLLRAPVLVRAGLISADVYKHGVLPFLGLDPFEEGVFKPSAKSSYPYAWETREARKWREAFEKRCRSIIDFDADSEDEE